VTKYDARVPPVTSVGHTGITVSDLGRSRRFYSEILHLEVSETLRLTGPAVSRITGVAGAELDVAYVRCPGHILELLCFIRPALQEVSWLRPCSPGFMHLCLKVARLDSVVRAMESADFEPIGPIETIAEGPAAGMRVVYARDPDGIVIELIEEPIGICFEELFFPVSSAVASGKSVPTKSTADTSVRQV
jgi:catechol 2,3-dioxygenase-like lactoylglutathione lyase family enzyme